MFSADLLRDLDALGEVIFSDVHIGLPASSSFYYIGYNHHPCVMSLHPVCPIVIIICVSVTISNVLTSDTGYVGGADSGERI